ncbi:MAG: tRNA lysidine(34) synthetase TilS [Zoogloeaceae bacterium]|jgi:tRNA(Ile)-lysidine synthase|nr:tRNA lysidine(34) synthetase TilS [Zoogloeaceae bacterium]
MVVSGKPDPAEAVAALLRAFLPAEAVLWVGFSGGRDSATLLHLCQQHLPPGRLKALHVHHGLSEHADAWAAFCAEFCAERGIPLITERVEVDTHSGLGLEAAARAARYRAFHLAARAHGLRYLALAHHQRDQAETLLLNLCRGAGVAGAAAMPAVRDMGCFTLLRPLLACAAREVEACARNAALTWVEDESNQDEYRARNFLRHRILPQLAEHFPAIETTLARAAGHFHEAQTLLAERAHADDLFLRGIHDTAHAAGNLHETQMPPRECARVGDGHLYGTEHPATGHLPETQAHFPERASGETLRPHNAGCVAPRLAALMALSPARQANWLRNWLMRKGWHVPSEARLAEALRQLAGLARRKESGNFALSLPEGSLHLWRGGLYCVPRVAPEAPRFWDGQTPCPWAGGTLTLEERKGEGIDPARLAGQHLELRPRQGGERLRLSPLRPERPLKDLLRESALPPWTRTRLPLLYLENTFIACPNIGIAANWQCHPEAIGRLPIWRATEENFPRPGS